MPAFVAGLGHGQRRLDGHARRLEVAVPPLDTPADLLARLRDTHTMIQRIDANLKQIIRRRALARPVVLALLFQPFFFGLGRGGTGLLELLRGGLACVTNMSRISEVKAGRGRALGMSVYTVTFNLEP